MTNRLIINLFCTLAKTINLNPLQINYFDNCKNLVYICVCMGINNICAENDYPKSQIEPHTNLFLE